MSLPGAAGQVVEHLHALKFTKRNLSVYLLRATVHPAEVLLRGNSSSNTWPAHGCLQQKRHVSRAVSQNGNPCQFLLPPVGCHVHGVLIFPLQISTLLSASRLQMVFAVPALIECIHTCFFTLTTVIAGRLLGRSCQHSQPFNSVKRAHLPAASADMCWP